MSLLDSSNNGAVNIWGGNGRFINNGKVDSTAKSVVVSASNAAATDAFFWNMSEGEINFDRDNASAVKFTHNNYVAQNDGTMNISGNNAVAMEGTIMRNWSTRASLTRYGRHDRYRPDRYATGC